MAYIGTLFFVVGLYGVISTRALYIQDISKTQKITVQAIYKPKSIHELRKIVSENKGPVSIAGARCSQGGQIGYPNGIVIDMTNLCKVVSFDLENKLITVEAGIIWRDLQKVIDPHNLAVRVMQSYNDFTVGGSVSVNVHARMVHEGAMINSIESLEVVNDQGDLIVASRTKNSELFAAIIGGYGLLGIIATVTLRLADNEPMEQKVIRVKTIDIHKIFTRFIASDPDILFFNAVVYPFDFEHADIVTFHRTKMSPTVEQRLGSARSWNATMLVGEQLLRRFPFLSLTRKKLQGKSWRKKRVVWRNYEMSAYVINDLEPFVRYPSTSILQEYFVPVEQLNHFMMAFKAIVKKYGINVLNASIRYVPADTESLLAYSPVDSYAIVLYINIWNTNSGIKDARLWTQKLIDAVLLEGGRYYLPYHTFATKQQFDQTYPEFNCFLQLKKQFDPTNKFRNMLLVAYQ